MIGSYPFQDDGRPNTNIVVRSRDPEKLAAAKAAVEDDAGARAAPACGRRREAMTVMDRTTRRGAAFC